MLKIDSHPPPHFVYLCGVLARGCTCVILFCHSGMSTVKHARRHWNQFISIPQKQLFSVSGFWWFCLPSPWILFMCIHVLVNSFPRGWISFTLALDAVVERVRALASLKKKVGRRNPGRVKTMTYKQNRYLSLPSLALSINRNGQELVRSVSK